MSRYAFGKAVEMPFERAVEAVTQALAAEGFGVLTEIDVAATLKKKLGLDRPPYRILGACNPQFAARALEVESQIGALLPCNVVVRVDLNGTEEQDSQASTCIFDLQRKLIRCVSIHNEIESVVVKAGDDLRNGKIRFAPGDQVVRPPSVPDLETKAESFLQGAKLAIGAATRITEPYYGKDFGHLLHKFESWAVKTFDEKHPYRDFAQQWTVAALGQGNPRDARCR